MKAAFVIARILLGLVFFASGLSGFFLISNPPALPPGLAGEFQAVFFRSGWVLFVDAVELIGGLLLLTNRFVPLALTLLAAVIANILVFHVTMMPAGLPLALFVTLLWAIVALRFRSSFMPLFIQRAEPVAVDHSTLQLGHSRS
jgi:putative oxidoreductase